MGNQLPSVELVPGLVGQRVLATGYSFCVTVGGTSLNCWGNNENGVLGQELPGSGTTRYIGDEVGVSHIANDEAGMGDFWRIRQVHHCGCQPLLDPETGDQLGLQSHFH